MAENSDNGKVDKTNSFSPLSEPDLIEDEKLDPIKCWGYCRNTVRTVITYVLCFVTLGLLLLVFYWKPEWRLKLMYVQCHLSQADAVLIQDFYYREHVKHIKRLHVNDNSTVTKNDLDGILKKDVLIHDELRYFCYQKLKYIWDVEKSAFFVLRAPELDTPCDKFCRELQSGLSEEGVEARREIFGLNRITVEVKPIMVMLVQEVLNPFYIFQVFSIAVWLGFAFWTFTTVIIVMTIISLAMSLYAIRKQSITLREMTESFLKVEVLRADGSTSIELEDQLVPGDVIIIPQGGCTMTCDAVLTNGTCIVNESMLTGESVPVTKVSLSSQGSSREQSDIYSPEKHKRHTLFCGTQVIQTRQSGSDYVKAVVVQTGFSTMKGTLVRSILFPRPMEFKLYRDAMMFVGAFVALALVAVVYSAWVLSNSGTKTGMNVLLTLDALTIAIQPLLPVSLTIGMLFAQMRLKKQNIFCISPQRINLSGVLDVVCFDKTGTLTEDGLDLLGFRRVLDNAFSSMEATATSLAACPFLHTLVTCHSLAIIDGTIQGDPMDVKMFEATGWTLEEIEEKGDEGDRVTIVKPSNLDQHASAFALLKQFTFSSSLQRMSVIAQSQTSNELAGFVKGSPEMIVSLCKKDSIPEAFNATLDSYTSQGYRVLALAWKPITDDGTSYDSITRDELESDLKFLGILIWQNKLKPESLPTITELQTSNIRTIMVTGDNILTAISVAGQCGMVSPDDIVTQVTIPSTNNKSWTSLEYKKIIRDAGNVAMATSEMDCQENLICKQRPAREHYALDGKTFAHIQEHCSQELPAIVFKGTIFARMAPDQKQELVEELQELEYSVGMCGDGANDCGALKTAHAGISLSEAEASVASPFTSKIPNITCVPILIKEGRSALVTSFGLFKYIAMYTYIMYASVCIIKWFGIYPTNNMFTFWDIALATPVVLLMGRSAPHEEIAAKKPPTRLIRAPTLFSVIFHVAILTISQAVVIFMVRGEPWYTKIDVSGSTFDQNWESTCVFLIANFQYVIYGVLFTPGRPYRQPIWKNPIYLIFLVIVTIVCLFLLFAPIKKMEEFLWGIHHIPDFKFRVMLFLLFLANTVVSFVMEFLIIPREGFQKFLRCWRKESLPKFETMKMEMQLEKIHAFDCAV